MIPVIWRSLIRDQWTGGDTFMDMRAEIPRVPRVGDYVEDEKVVKVTWNERMDRVTVYLQGEK